MKFNKENISNRKLIIVIAFVSLSAAIGSYALSVKSQNIEDYSIERPDSGADNKTMALNVFKDNELAATVTVDIEPRKKRPEELEEYFDCVYQEVMEDILGDNSSLSEVVTDLRLNTLSRDGAVNLEWYSDNYEIINYNGTVNNSDFSRDYEALVHLRLVMKYGRSECEYSIPVNVKPPEYSEEQWQKEIIARAVKDAVNDNQYEQTINLPQTIQGEDITYSYQNDNNTPYIFIGLGVLAILVVLIGEKNKAKEEINRRKKELVYDYSEMISKLTLLLGAGMTTRKAWSKIVEDYISKRDSGAIPRKCVYEEMYEAECNMRSGVPELAAYESFGRRCNTKEYIKLASLLQTNIKKGTRELAELLERESLEAFEQRKNIARKKGEEATTKLLLPMIMMLLIVMVIIMVPAIMSFNI